MNWLLTGVASIGVVVCLTAFVLFATSSVWAFLILVTIIGICIYGSGSRARTVRGAEAPPAPEESTR